MRERCRTGRQRRSKRFATAIPSTPLPRALHAFFGGDFVEHDLLGRPGTTLGDPAETVLSALESGYFSPVPSRLDDEDSCRSADVLHWPTTWGMPMPRSEEHKSTARPATNSAGNRPPQPS